MLKTFVTTVIAGLFVTIATAAPVPQQDEQPKAEQEQPRAEQDRPSDGDREADRPREEERDGERERAGDRERDADSPRGDRRAEEGYQYRQSDMQRDRYIAQMRGRLEELRNMREKLGEDADEQRVERIQREIKETEQQLEELVKHGRVDRRGGDSYDRDPRRQAMQRIEHLMIAADHLDRAGMRDMAHAIRQRAEELERNPSARIERRGNAEADHRERDEDAGERRDRERPGEGRGAAHEMREMKEQLDALRKQVSSLKEQLGEQE